MEHTTMELSQKLHDAGFRGEHKYSWMIPTVNGNDLPPFCGDNENSVAHKRICPAWTFTELWRVLPEKIDNLGYKVLLPCWVCEGCTEASYVIGGKFGRGFHHESPAEAMGLLLLWLIEQGYLRQEGNDG